MNNSRQGLKKMMQFNVEIEGRVVVCWNKVYMR